MKRSVKLGFSFGLTSGIITTLGLIVGLHSGTHSKAIIIGGILTIAFADAFSDALGIHVSQESQSAHTAKEIWQSTIATFWAKFLFALTFIAPITLFKLTTAIWVSIAWGLFLLGLFSFFIATEQKVKAWKVILEHVTVALIVILITHYIGDWISTAFS